MQPYLPASTFSGEIAVSPDQLVLVAMGIVVVLWWLDCAPLYILAGKAGIEGPGWAFMPLVQCDVMGRVATAYTIGAGPGMDSRTMPWQRNLWAEIGEGAGLSSKLGHWCLAPGPHLVAQWMIALRA